MTLTQNENYVAIANGVLTPGYHSQILMEKYSFYFIYKSNGRETGTTNKLISSYYMVQPMHQQLMLRARRVATLVDNASYSDITNYITVPARLTLDVISWE